MWSALHDRFARIRDWIDRFMWGGVAIKLTPWRVFLLVSVTFWLVFALPYYSKSQPYEIVPYDPVRGLVGGACFGLIAATVAWVFQDRDAPGTDSEAPGPDRESPGPDREV